MTATTHVLDESSMLTKTSSPERPVSNAPTAAETSPTQCIVIEFNGGRALEAPLPQGYASISELTKRFEREPKKKSAIAKARGWLADYSNEGPTLRTLRLKKGLSQASLGEQVGMTQAHIARLESGRCDAQITTVVRLASALGVKPAVLFKALVVEPKSIASRKK